MDSIVLRGLAASTILGVHEWERTAPRTVLVDLEIACDAAAAAATDDVEDVVDYATVAQAIHAFAARSRFRLVESLAEGIASLIRRDFAAPWVRVRVEKQGAVPGCAHVSIVVERGERPA